MTDFLYGMYVTDVLAMGAVLGVVWAVFSLPESLKLQYVLSYADPAPLPAYTAHFVHLSEVHLVSNLAAFVLLVTAGYAFAVLSGTRERFMRYFLVAFTVLPLAISALNILLVRPRVGYGLSPIVMGFLGYLPLAMTAFISHRITPVFDLDFAPMFFFAGASIIAVQAVPSPANAVLGATSVAILVGYVVVFERTLDEVRDSTRAELSHGVGEIALLLGGITVFAWMPFVAFPADPITSGRITNLYSHLLGFALGFLAPYITFRLIR